MDRAEFRKRILEANERAAAALRGRFAETLVVDLVSSPGSGKTSLLEATAGRLAGPLRMGTVVGDIATELDADRLRRAGMPSHQIVTGGACHLDARMVTDALVEVDFLPADLLFLENVGNLVCPASYALGEDFKVALLSVAEGDDKPFKYPAIFARASVTLITKVDLLPHVRFDLERAMGQIRSLNPAARIVPTSIVTGQGVDEWSRLLQEDLAAKRATLGDDLRVAGHAALPLPALVDETILALGGHLKASACLARCAEAWPARNVGDLDCEGARVRLARTALALERRAEARATTFVTDLHPDYASTLLGERLAAESGGRVLGVQHHLAHAAAVLAERGRFPEPHERVAAIVLDGTGLGTDGTAWGAEWLMIDGDLGWSRLAHGTELALVGGEAAVREPWRVACAALADAAHLLPRSPLADAVAPERLETVAALSRNGRWPLATGAGRVFEAAGALLCPCAVNTFEGEAAVRFERLAADWPDPVQPWVELGLPKEDVIPTDRLLVAGLERVLAGEPRARVAAGFHATFAALAARLARRVLPPDVRIVALGGGCLVNRILARVLGSELRRRDFEPLFPDALSPGDRALSYGQVVIAAIARARGREPLEKGRGPCVSQSPWS